MIKDVLISKLRKMNYIKRTQPVELSKNLDESKVFQKVDDKIKRWK